MYLHLGKGTVIAQSEIIGIFDLDITSQSHLTRKYLSAAEKAGQVINAAVSQLFTESASFHGYAPFIYTTDIIFGHMSDFNGSCW